MRKSSEMQVQRIDAAIAAIEKRIKLGPDSVKMPLWKLKIEDLQKDKKLVQSGTSNVVSLDSHRKGVTITPPSGNFFKR